MNCIAVIALIITPVYTATPQAEIDVLWDIYRALNGSQWMFAEGTNAWHEGTDPCDDNWTMVECRMVPTTIVHLCVMLSQQYGC